MIDRTAPNEPYAPPAPLEAIVADLRDHGIRPTRFNVIRAVIERGSNDEFAAAIAARIEDGEILAPLSPA